MACLYHDIGYVYENDYNCAHLRTVQKEGLNALKDICDIKYMCDNEFKTYKKENIDLGGINVSKQYYSNPSRDNDYQWDHVGVNYVFPKEDTNYSIEVHYFTTYDYNNKTYTKELDDRIEDMIGNIHNKEYNGFFFWNK